nr:uncharacterized protein C8orf58 homolog [Pogona vitticeps]XP_020635981.1 uncharacterized protein C8orf58 homolog [Pogona vitticeps]XP_020635982.1 uncharacterized protein C8orf58 homolog [Pogona vitticeps]XP_020635983.1 uncharacterized protein C8orf58 homolog [Pogona vitticeps]XP_020635984.1 uncharacterized protein C8orf58 homolog [Pogona vitticeps]XP_020635985.1 uncharacterized protein C8orf58 homolog [Pogona vitticeps]XP_020635986.1 uncharacterized protein C8orf58 homolog [Pogona vitticep
MLLGRRRVFSVEPLWNRGSAWRPVKDCVVLTSVSMTQQLQAPHLEFSFSPELEGKMSSQVERWSGAESPAESVPHKVGFSPMSGRLLKSESEDSGMEMASNDHSLSSPAGSERSFFLDFVDGFHPSVEDSPPPPPYESCPKGEGQEVLPGPTQDGTRCQNLSDSKEAAQPALQPQKRCPRPLSRMPCALKSLEGPPAMPRPTSIDDLMEMLGGGDGQPAFDCNYPEEPSVKDKVKNEPLLAMPGEGLLYLEHICQMMEKIAQLQRTNLQLQHRQRNMERWARVQEFEKKGFFEETPESPGLARVESQWENSAAPEMEEAVTAEEGPNSFKPWHLHHFRARSASDTHVLRRPAHASRSKASCSRKAALNAVSSPSALDQLDGGSRTLPPGMKLKSEHSRWCRIKGLFNRITRRSVRTNEPTSCGEPAPSNKHSRADVVKDRQESHRRWRFLPSLGPQKHRSKQLSMQ